eukprot:4468367-Prymnesium_polylepis.1
MPVWRQWSRDTLGGAQGSACGFLLRFCYTQSELSVASHGVPSEDRLQVERDFERGAFVTDWVVGLRRAR